MSAGRATASATSSSKVERSRTCAGYVNNASVALLERLNAVLTDALDDGEGSSHQLRAAVDAYSKCLTTTHETFDHLTTVNDLTARLAVEHALISLINVLSRLSMSADRTYPRWLATVDDAIDACPHESLSVSRLAALAGVHPSHLLRTFRRYHGTTVAHCLRQRRLERARNEIARSKHRLSAIAAEAGFADQSHFTRAFRLAFGETPGEYARSLRHNEPIGS